MTIVSIVCIFIVFKLSNAPQITMYSFLSYYKFVNQTKERSYNIKIQFMLHPFAGSTKSLDCIGCSEASKGLNVLLRIYRINKRKSNYSQKTLNPIN